jgi:hypothetical protein
VVRDSEIRARTQQFAEKIATVLNGTVTHSATFWAALISRDQAAFGTMDPKRLNEPASLKLTTVSPSAYLWLDLGYTMFLNEDNHLTVHSSFVTLATGPDAEHQLFHYDYERNKPGYPEAHLQLCMDSRPMKDLLAGIGRPRDDVEDLHFPVGGRRYRPPLEDIIEFLIMERLVHERAGARALLDRHRDEFRRIQLKAAIKSDVPTAIEALQLEGYEVRKRDVGSRRARRRSRQRRST